jgi:hypothetical protein
VFENKVLRRLFRPNRQEVIGDGENCIMRSFTICTVTCKVIRFIWIEKAALKADMINVNKILVGKSEHKVPFGTPRHRWDG